MTEDFNNNISIIAQRWPNLSIQLKAIDTSIINAHLVEGTEQTISIDNIQLSSRHNRKKEAQLLASQHAQTIEHINVYGTGLGDLQRELLGNEKLRFARVFILNLENFALVLQHTSQADWLSDPRIELIYLSNATRVENPFIAISPELKLADQNNTKLCDHLNTALQQDFIYKSHRSLPPEASRNIRSNQALIELDNDIAELFDNFTGCSALLVGSGPSLENSYPLLINAQEQPNTIVIAVDTALKALEKYGITPDIAVSVDHEIKPIHLDSSDQQAIKLAYFPSIGHSALLDWKGPRYTAYSSSSLYDTQYQQCNKGRLFVGGSVIHSATDLAVKIGASSITFFGCDFSFPNNKTHAAWKAQELDLAMNEGQCLILNGLNEKVPTVPSFRSYLCVLEEYIKDQHHVKFYNSSKEGAIISGTEYC